MRILIADDEAFVVEGLTLLLHQNLPQVEIMTADNGRSALAVLRERGAEPDLLITDLNMPLMDGIELSQQIRRRYPRCRIMIISGYEDFEAARSAIELGALRYMLKPINHTEMVAYVRSVLEDVVREQDERIRHSTDRLESLLVDLHNHMLLDAPYGGAERIDRETGDYCAVRLAVVSLPGGEGVPSLRPAVEKALKSRGGPGYLIRAEGAQATLLLCDFGEEDVSWLEGLPQELAAAVRYPVAVGVGRRCGALREVHQSYRTAGMAVWRSYLADGHAVCFDDDLTDAPAEENRMEAAFRLRQETKRMMDFYTLVPEKQQLTHLMNTFLAQLERLDCPLGMRQLMCAGLVMELLSSGYVPGLGMENSLERYLHLEFYTACGSWTQLREMMGQFVQVYSALLERVGNSGSSRLVQSIRSAIHADLRNASLSQVADTLNMSPSYISMIFKEKTGQNFKDYLFQTRMNHAKRLLRQGMAIGEIARQLGYEDTEHFSRRFRAQFGLSPMAYRKEAPAGPGKGRVAAGGEKAGCDGLGSPALRPRGPGTSRGPRSSPGGGEARVSLRAGCRQPAPNGRGPGGFRGTGPVMWTVLPTAWAWCRRSAPASRAF